LPQQIIRYAIPLLLFTNHQPQTKTPYKLTIEVDFFLRLRFIQFCRYISWFD